MSQFVGPSYELPNRKASIQRAVNMYLVQMEAGAKSVAILQSVPGLVLRATADGEYRGGIETNDRAFVVYGQALYELGADHTLNLRGNLATSTGAVSMAYGLFQVVMVDGDSLYVLKMADNTFERVTVAAFTGASTVDFCDNYFILSKDRIGQQYQITAINDATLIDGLDFASAESSPDELVGHIVVQAGILMFGTRTCELHVNTGALDFPFERSRGSGFQVGLMAAASLKLVDNAPMWIGRDKNGAGIVYRLVGGQAARVSNDCIELTTSLARPRVFWIRPGLAFCGMALLV